jgi:hypothetical protein
MDAALSDNETDKISDIVFTCYRKRGKTQYEIKNSLSAGFPQAGFCVFPEVKNDLKRCL